MRVAIKTYFTGKAFTCSHGYCFQIGFVEMKIQMVLENNTNPFTCSKSDGTESIIVPSENLKGQGKGSLLKFEYLHLKWLYITKYLTIIL